jgi:hypothetical protein
MVRADLRGMPAILTLPELQAGFAPRADCWEAI